MYRLLLFSGLENNVKHLYRPLIDVVILMSPGQLRQEDALILVSSGQLCQRDVLLVSSEQLRQKVIFSITRRSFCDFRTLHFTIISSALALISCSFWMLPNSVKLKLLMALRKRSKTLLIFALV